MARRVPSITEATAKVVCLRSLTNSRKPASKMRSMLPAGRRELTIAWNSEFRSDPLQNVRSKSSALRRASRTTKALRKMNHQDMSDIDQQDAHHQLHQQAGVA